MLRPGQQRKILTEGGLDPLAMFKDSLRVDHPWESIVDFATHSSYCGKELYPRQLTFLKLAFLEIDNFTDYDYDVLEEWMGGYWKQDPYGVPPDVLDRVAYLKANGYRWFPHIQMVMGRRGSKGVNGGIIAAHQMAHMLSLDNWQSHYSIDPQAVAYAAVVAVNQTQATRTLFNDLRGTVESCKYFEGSIVTPKADHLTLRTAGDVRKIASMQARGIPIEREIASVQAVAASSNSASIRGNSMFFLAFDEMAHMLSGTGGVRTSEELYHAMQPSLDQFGTDSMIYVPSSPWSKIGIFYELYREGRALIKTGVGNEVREITEAEMDEDADEGIAKIISDPHKLVVQLPSWALYKDWEKAHLIKQGPRRRDVFFPPKSKAITVSPEEDDRVAQYEASNPEKFKVERRGQFASVMDAYLREDMVENMFRDPEWRDTLVPQTFGKFNTVYRMHCDPARVNDNFAMAIGHLEEAPPDKYGNVWPHVVFDVLKVWKPSDFKGHIIDYNTINEDLDVYLTKFPSINKCTFDQHNSAGCISYLNRLHGPRIRIFESTFTKEANERRFERFKSALYLEWVHAYRDNYFDDGKSLLEHELKFLQRLPTGKIDHPSAGPVQSKDLADAVMVVVEDLLHEYLDRWQKSLLGQVAFGSSDVGALRSVTGAEIGRLDAFQSMGGSYREPPTPGSMRERLARQASDRSRAKMGRGAYSSTTRGGRWR